MSTSHPTSSDPSASQSLDTGCSGSFGQTVRAARKRKDLTLRELSGEVDLHFSYLSRIENDRLPHPPSEEVVRRLSRRLDLNADRAMVKAGWIPDWLRSYLVDNEAFTARLMKRIQQDPDAPL
jgi:transcriptional regulator with XRE-family HTH domain